MSRRLALVTGGSRGIGRAIAARLAGEGWDVVAVARHAPDPLPEDFAFRACDVSEPEAARAVIAGLPRLDALIAAAGIAGAGPLDPSGDELWHRTIAGNLHATYYCCSAAVPRLPDRTGRIVTIASTLGLRGVPGQTAYCAAKHGVVGYTRALALALAPRGITVNAICPGWTDTDMAAQRFVELGISREQAAAGVPIGRIAAPEEIAALTSFLLSPEAASMTGLALPVDGGGLASP
ncbi:MAG TPA: SDR family NAD(P)-dependent oxidoreductase [Acetobacteraceae bacterium]|nr:SDR family NAD(P)-dependent oxidoreductase [Acetobacteraceae bacterium]